jgi:eukaryotic-like serine/threonine-protein kinase
MNEAHSEPELVGQLAESFLARYRRGERPSLTEYTVQHPELAEQIRELFPALAVLEELGSVEGPAPLVPKLEFGNERGVLADAPQRLGEFRIIREVARGGMGIVYEAVQESLGRHVALKVLPAPRLMSPMHLERFRREARAAAKLHHTNIVPVFGVGEHGGVHYYAMQFIQGQSLDLVLDELKHLRGSSADGKPQAAEEQGRSDHSVCIAKSLMAGRFQEADVAKGEGKAQAEPKAVTGSGDASPVAAAKIGTPLVPTVEFENEGKGTVPLSSTGSHSGLATQPEAQYFLSVARVGMQVADALAYAHHQGILHRDIKPPNLLLDTQGTVWVTDFGLAKLEGTDELTHPGDIVGTLRYMAPERFSGQADPRSDVYSLGLTLYEMLTLCPAFMASERSRLIERVLHEEPPPPRKLEPRIPRDLETIVLKAIAKDPRDRFATAAALAEDLRRFLGGQPIRARPVSAWERAVKWARRRPAIAGLLASLLLVIALGFAGVVWQWRRAEATGQALADKAKELEIKNYASNIALAASELSSGNLGRYEELLDECREELRGWEWHYLKRLRQVRPITLPVRVERTATGGGTDMAFSPDGRLLAVPDVDGTIKLCDVTSGEGRALTPRLTLRGHRGCVLRLAFSPDGRSLASTSEDTTIRIWNPTTGAEKFPPLRGHTKGVNGVAFSPDGQRLASTGLDDQIMLWDTTTAKELFHFEGRFIHKRHVTVAFSPDSRRFASGSVDNTVKVWDVTTGHEILCLRGHTDAVYSVAFSPDGQRLASSSWDSSLKVWDVATGREVCTFPGSRDSVVYVTFSPDGQRLAVGDEMHNGTVRVYDATTGRIALTLQGHSGRITSLAFSPDGRRLVSSSFDKTIKLWEMETGREVLTLREHTDLVGGVLFDAQGRRLASSSEDGTVRIWDATPPEASFDSRIRTFGGHTGIIYSVAFSPNGQYLASASADQSVKIWDADPRRAGGDNPLITLRGHTGPVFSVAFQTNECLATASYDRTVKLWDIRALAPDGAWSGDHAPSELTTPQRTLVECRGGIRSMALSASGRRLATCDTYRTLQLWDTTTGHPLYSLVGHEGWVWSVTISPDEKRIATAGTDGTARLWDTTTGQEIRRLHHASRVQGVAFSPDSQHLASGDADGKVIISDADTGAALHTLADHTDYVFGLAFSPDGRLLASASWKEVIVWDTKTGTKITTLRGLAGNIWSVAFSPDGRCRLQRQRGNQDLGYDVMEQSLVISHWLRRRSNCEWLMTNYQRLMTIRSLR